MSDSQDYVTDYKRVEKAGSAHHGAGVWLRERISGLLLAPLTVWGVWEIGRGDGFGYDALVRWMRVSIVNPILLTLFVLITAYHMHMGLRVVIDDYLHKPLGKGLALMLNLIVCLLVAAVTLFAIARVAFAGDIGVSI